MNNPMERKFLSLCVCICGCLRVYACIYMQALKARRQGQIPRAGVRCKLYVRSAELELPNTGIGSTHQLSTRAADTLNP